MSDIDSIIAGVSGNTRADFSGIGNLPKAYWEGRDQKAKNDLRDAFKDGVPLTPDGQLDTQAVMKTLFQKGDIAGGAGLIGASAAAQDRTDYIKSLGPQQPVNVPSANRTAQAVVAPPLNKGGVQGDQGQGGQPATVMTILAQHVPNDQLGAASSSLARQLGVDPTTPLNMQDPQVRNVLVPALAQIKKMGLGQVQPPQPGDNQPQQPQAAQMQAPQGFQPSPAQVAAQNDPELKRAKYFAASRDKEIAASALSEQKAIQESRQPTNPMKEAAASGIPLQQYQERQGEQAAQQAGAVEAAKGYVTKYNNIDEAGTKAIQEIPKLQLALKQMDSPDFQSGSGQRFDLAYRRLAVRLGGDPDKAAPQEIVSKVIADSVLNGLGSLKGLGPIRVAEMNLARTAAMSMDNTPQTNKFLANVAIRIQQRAVEVSDMAQSYNDGVLDVGFDKKLREMDKNKPLFTPDEVQRFHKIIGGEEKQPKQQPAKQGSSPTFGTKSDLRAAIASGSLKKGDSFIGGDGVERTVP